MGIIIIIAVAGIWAIGIFLGVIGGLSKTFQPTPSAMDSTEIKTQEQKSIDDTEDKRQKLMDDMKEKLQDEKYRH